MTAERAQFVLSPGFLVDLSQWQVLDPGCLPLEVGTVFLKGTEERCHLVCQLVSVFQGVREGESHLAISFVSVYLQTYLDYGAFY